MDVGIRSPLLDFFRRGEVAKDVRLLAARGALAPRAHEQVALLAMLTEDGDAEIRAAAEATIAAIPNESLAFFLGRSDVPDGLREFFRGRGIEPMSGGDIADDPLIDPEAVATAGTSAALASGVVAGGCVVSGAGAGSDSPEGALCVTAAGGVRRVLK